MVQELCTQSWSMPDCGRLDVIAVPGIGDRGCSGDRAVTQLNGSGDLQVCNDQEMIRLSVPYVDDEMSEPEVKQGVLSHLNAREAELHRLDV